MLGLQITRAKRTPLLIGITIATMLAMSSVLVAQPAVAAPNPLIIITETGGSTNVHPDGPITDSYTIQLATPSTGRTWFTLIPTTPTAPGLVEVSIDGGLSWGTGKMVLNIPAGDMAAHTVMVRWAHPTARPDDFPPGSSAMVIQHPADSLDPDYDSTVGANVDVSMDPVIPPTLKPPTTMSPSTMSPMRPARIETAVH